MTLVSAKRTTNGIFPEVVSVTKLATGGCGAVATFI